MKKRGQERAANRGYNRDDRPRFLFQLSVLWVSVLICFRSCSTTRSKVCCISNTAYCTVIKLRMRPRNIFAVFRVFSLMFWLFSYKIVFHQEKKSGWSHHLFLFSAVFTGGIVNSVTNVVVTKPMQFISETSDCKLNSTRSSFENQIADRLTLAGSVRRNG